MSTGTAAVEVRRCRHCHDEGAAALQGAAPAAVHGKHVTGKGIGCDWCHGVVHHGGVDGVAKAD
jgi:nitrate/TMAO reductase-like tetraheme cytochrome c subunit